MRAGCKTTRSHGARPLSAVVCCTGYTFSMRFSSLLETGAPLRSGRPAPMQDKLGARAMIGPRASHGGVCNLRMPPSNDSAAETTPNT